MTEQELTKIMKEYIKLYNKKPGPGADPAGYAEIDRQQGELLSQLIIWFDMDRAMLDVSITNRDLAFEERLDFIMAHKRRKPLEA